MMFNFKSLVASLALTPLLFLTTHTAAVANDEPRTYSEADRQKAIIMCMTAEYVKFYQEYPAEEDVMPLCHQRFEQLITEIPYAEYEQWVLQTPYSAYPNSETSSIMMRYNKHMLGLDNELFIFE